MSSGNHRTESAISVDVEEWLNATVLQETGKVFPPGESIVRNSEALLDLFSETGARATWFFLGEVAERFPGLVAKVAAAGHELGIHGFHHHQIRTLERAQYRDFLRRAKAVVEDAGGARAIGYRAVDFGMNRETWWVLDELLDAGFLYDSSIFPAWTPRYGVPGATTTAHWVTALSGRRIFEVPVSVCSVIGLRIPFAGGGWFRMLPFTASQLLALEAARRGPLVYYMHPCEIETKSTLGALPDDLAPNERARVKRMFVSQSRGQSQGLWKYRRLLSTGRFLPIAEVFRVTEQRSG